MNRALVRDLVERVSLRTPVVMLDTAWSTDEHRDYGFDEIAGVTTRFGRRSIEDQSRSADARDSRGPAVHRHLRWSGMAGSLSRRRYARGVKTIVI